MTRIPAARRGAEVVDRLRRLDAGTVLTIALIAGLVLRLFIAGPYLPLSGFRIDIGDFTAWAQRLASVGPPGFYETGYFSDYPPGYLYVLWLLGGIGALLAPSVGQDATGGLVKIPGIVADVGVAWLLFLIARRWAGTLLARPSGGRIGPAPETLGLAAATVYLFNPGSIFNAAVWGQVDSVGTLAMVATVYLLGRGRTEAAAVMATVALLLKFQYALLIPVVAIVGIKRHLLGRSSDPQHDGRPDPVRVATSLTAGLVTLFALAAPFRMTLYAPLAGGDPRGLLGLFAEADPTRSLVGKFVEAANTYTGLSINAFNPWRNPWSGLGDTLQWGNDTATAFGLAGMTITWQAVGTILFAGVAVLALWQVARRDDMRGLLVAALVLAIAFFVLPTRVHERYLFPALALAAPLVLRSPGWAVGYAAISASLFLNTYWVYTEDWSWAGVGVMNPGLGGAPMPQDPLLSATLLTDIGIYLLSAMSAVVLLVVVSRSLRLGIAGGRVESQPITHTAAPESPVVVPPAPAAPAPATPAPASPASPPRPPPRRFGSARRLSRRDAAIILGFVLFALAFRLWRLDVPRGMHFDEVYHARSATEWLANWQHGWRRDVYEWTHPMLAKYLIAGGILVADPNRVVGQLLLDGAANALAVAPARSLEGRPRSVAFTAAGEPTIAAYDAVTGEPLASWRAGGQVAALAWDERGTRLLVGRADSGEIEAYDLAAFLGVTGERGPPPLTERLATGLASVQQIVVGDEASVLLARGPGAVASIERASGNVLATVELDAAGIAWLPAHGDDELPERLVVTVPSVGTIAFRDATTLEPAGPRTDVVVGADLLGSLVARGSGDEEQVFALTGPLGARDDHPATAGGLAVLAVESGQPQTLVDVAPLPGAPAHIAWQPVANIVYVAGVDEDGAPVAWTIEPHGESRGTGSSGFAAFDATDLPGAPLAMAFDVSRASQADDHGHLLISTAGTADGAASLTVLDAGSNAFAWRLAGVVFGAILVGVVYLLAATLFARRRVAILAAAFVALDGMSFVMGRIAMNDIFVATIIVAAYTLFWQVWSGRWRRSAWWALPAVGVLIGLAAATKWVGFYALAGLLVLVLARSSLGRALLVAALAFVVAVSAVGAPWPFALLTLISLMLVLAAAYFRPLHFDPRELASALPASALVLGGIGLALTLAYPTVDGRAPSGGVEILFSVLARGLEAGWPAVVLLVVAALLIALRAGASLRRPASDARWFMPAELGGFAWPWVGACLVILPLAVYAVSYLPYLDLGHAVAVSNTGPGYGWSLDELHAQMFGYHFGLSAGHASASPWWSWPLALKPTWFYSGDLDGRQIAVIYNGGNPILFWAGVPALVLCGWLAWRQRSLALALLVAAFAFQFLPWARIERASFAYHYLTAVIFAMVAVAYVVDLGLRRVEWRDVAIGYLALAVVIGILIFPLGAALPMPDWYVTAARALPPWNYGFQFPGPPQGERGDLLGTSLPQLVVGCVLAVLSVAFAIFGRRWWLRRTRRPSVAEAAEG